MRNPAPTSWRFAAHKTQGTIVFDDASAEQSLARATGLHRIHSSKADADGTPAYAIDQSR